MKYFLTSLIIGSILIFSYCEKKIDPSPNLMLLRLNEQNYWKESGMIQFYHPGGTGYEGKDGNYSVTLTKLSN